LRSGEGRWMGRDDDDYGDDVLCATDDRLLDDLLTDEWLRTMTG
jgi:hypothetical protein